MLTSFLCRNRSSPPSSNHLLNRSLSTRHQNSSIPFSKPSPLYYAATSTAPPSTVKRSSLPSNSSINPNQASISKRYEKPTKLSVPLIKSTSYLPRYSISLKPINLP